MRRWAGYEHGVNLGGWFSQCDYSQDRYDNFIKEEDIKTLAGWGLDHLRLPIDYNLVETEDGHYIEEGFERIQRVIDWCQNNSLNLIIDLHKTAGYSFDPGEEQNGFFNNEALQERFMKLWEQLASRYGKYGDTVAFELLNEVTEQSYIGTWNSLVKKTIDRIRVYAPDSYILVGSYWNNSAQAVKDLDAPYDDKTVINFHCYSPLIFTHQGAYWVKGMPSDYRIAFPKTYEEYAKESLKYLEFGTEDIKYSLTGTMGPEYFEWLFKEAIDFADKYNALMYCGEYGVIELANINDTLNWYKCISEAFNRHGIGRAAWSYRGMDFDLCGDRLKPVFDELKKCF